MPDPCTAIAAITATVTTALIARNGASGRTLWATSATKTIASAIQRYGPAKRSPTTLSPSSPRLPAARRCTASRFWLPVKSGKSGVWTVCHDASDQGTRATSAVVPATKMARARSRTLDPVARSGPTVRTPTATIPTVGRTE